MEAPSGKSKYHRGGGRASFPDRSKIKKSEKQIIADAMENSIRLRALSEFYRDKSLAKEKVFLINYSSASEEELEKAVEVLGNIL